ncbi:MAG: hypothetical protein OXI57_09125 [Rhodospirillales bacterium]|nr:hypothetical protein [Rhodospirillales bacterium]
MNNKYARICWNTLGWRMPSGDARRIETGQSYTVTHGFGHEEWLFNFEWLIDGYRYGFLQPIGKHYKRYAEHNCSILLYTVTPEQKTLLVGIIRHAYVPGKEVLDDVLRVTDDAGWLQTMRDDVERVKGDVAVLSRPSARELANIRFRPEDVEIFDPMRRVVGAHKISNIPRRYHPYDWTDGFPDTTSQPPPRARTDPRRAEDERTRAAQEGGIVDPRHVRLQNRLYGFLCNKFREGAVHYERDFVDVAVENADGITFYEIKMETTAKRCIRQAMGQLVEYAHYPESSKAGRLVVVGDAPPTDEDRSYLSFLRREYGMPIFYSCFDWDSGALQEEN